MILDNKDVSNSIVDGLGADRLLRSVTPDVIPKFKNGSTEKTPVIMNTGLKIHMPNNNFDEIVPVDHAKETYIELKEPNGNAYFIERAKNDNKTYADNSCYGESIVLQILDEIYMSNNDSNLRETDNDISVTNDHFIVNVIKAYDKIVNIEKLSASEGNSIPIESQTDPILSDVPFRQILRS